MSVKLNYKIHGEGQPLFVIHGLFGSLDNWQTHAKTLGSYFKVILVDARNHGHSPHEERHNYDLMAEDLFVLMKDLNLDKAAFIGHSMGGKVVMRFAQLYPELVTKLIVVDMGIKAYPMHHDVILEGLKSMDFDKITSRSLADQHLEQYVKDFAVRQFLLKNLYWIEPGKRLAWRMNLPVLEQEMFEILARLPEGNAAMPTLFLYGMLSNYVLEDDIESIEEMFTHAVFEGIEGAGHWVHAEKPNEFLDAVLRFLLF
jgi:pimeloyl-ACP methyl ester carboxylesterase